MYPATANIMCSSVATIEEKGRISVAK